MTTVLQQEGFGRLAGSAGMHPLVSGWGDRPLCVFITGPSGAGKSTLLRACGTHPLLDGRLVAIPRRHTTRRLRDEREHIELLTISDAELEELDADGEYIVRYCNYGAHYALPAAPFRLAEPTAEPLLLLQTLPTQTADLARSRLAPDWDVRICMLDADEGSLRRRLCQRGDSLTMERLEERVAGAKTRCAHLANKVLDANKSADAVYADFCSWLASLQPGRHSLSLP